MVHALYGEDHIHTSPKVPTPNKEKLLQRTYTGVIDSEAVEKMFRGQQQGDEQTVKKKRERERERATLTHCVCAS